MPTDGLPVAGYRPQSDAAIALVNGFKMLEEGLLRQIDTLRRSEAGVVDQRWLSIAQTSLEQGFMALNRSIFQPARVTLPEDLTSQERRLREDGLA